MIAALLRNRMGPVAGIASLKHGIELPAAARPGDRLTFTMTCVDKRRSASKPDRGLYLRIGRPRCPGWRFGDMPSSRSVSTTLS